MTFNLVLQKYALRRLYIVDFYYAYAERKVE